jgi:hypothetical protein
MNRFVFVTLGIVGAAVSQADTFTYLGPNSTHGQAHVTLSGVPGPTVNMTVITGENRFKYGSEAERYGYCVDLQSMAGNGGATKTNTLSLNAGLTIGHLLHAYAPTIHATGDKHGATALQLAIWDLLYDSADGNMVQNTHQISLTGGNFKANNIKVNGVAFDPTAYFNMFESGFNEWGVGDVYSGAGSIQSFATVPEPASIAALAVGAAALLRRRKASR